MKKFLKGVVVTSLLSIFSVSTYAMDRYAVSLGWQENESGQRFTKGYEDAFEANMVKDNQVIYSNANYDPKLQSEQIDAFIKMKPKALFITPSDPAGITQAVKRAIDAGIPVFVADGIIAGAAATTSITSNDFGMGIWSMRWLINKIGGKGKVALIDLPNNEAWDLRGQGARYELSQHPEVEVVAEWSYDATGAVSPRQAVENMLTAHPKGDLDGIWSAWDGAAMEGALAIKAAGREGEIVTTGIDGGEYAFSVMKRDGVFGLTMAQSTYYMAYNSVNYAFKFLNDGVQVPRFIIAPVYAVTPEELKSAPANAYEYDIPGRAADLGWEPVL